MTALTAPRPMPRLLARIVIASERWKLRSDDAYMRACERDGITNTNSMKAWRLQCQERRAYIATLEAGLK